MNPTNNKRFGHSQLEAYFFHPNFIAKTVIKHLQPRLSCSGDSQFESDIRKAFEPNKPV